MTDNMQEYVDADIPKLAYTWESPESGVFQESSNLLFEAAVREYRPAVSLQYNEFPVFFPVGESSLLPYDLFATVFYMATRYEEYQPYEPDKHGRFQAEQSLLFRDAILQKPFLNELIADFALKLKQQFPTLEFKKRAFNFLSTIDIDNAFAYAHKGFVRNGAGLLKDLFSFNVKKALERIAANRNDQTDPYNTFEQINALNHSSQTTLRYFALVGDYATYDKNPDYRNAAFRKLLKGLSENYEMGLHPSYESFNDPSKIETEKKRLEEIIEKKVTSIRCHFLRMKFPDTYRYFIKAGITDDYTMIYASQSGFRTGLCVPYQWFDLEKNEATNLTIHTSVVMEGTLRDYRKLTAEEAQKESLGLMEVVKKLGGEFISIYHNDTFVPAQHEWVKLYKTLLEESKL